MKIALTGHRPPRIQGEESRIENWIADKLTEYKCKEAYSGMAKGADMIFAKVALDLKIPLICCYPFRRKKYSHEEVEIMKKAKDVRYISENYTDNKVYWTRDKYLVDNCDILLAVWDGIDEGGTWLTIDYAMQVGKPIIYYKFMNGEPHL